MKFKKIFLFFFLLNFVIGSYFLPQQVRAAAPCQTAGVGAVLNPPQPIPEGSSFTITFKKVDAGSYKFRVGTITEGVATTDSVDSINESVTLTVKDSRVLKNGSYVGTLLKNDQEFCGDVPYKIGYEFKECTISFRPLSPITTNQPFQIDIHHARAGNYTIVTAPSPNDIFHDLTNITIDANGNGTTAVIPGFTSPQSLSVKMFMQIPFTLVQEFCGQTTLIVIPIGNGSPVPIPAPGTGGGAGGTNCTNNNTCSQSAGVSCDPETGNVGVGLPGVMTAIGCIPTYPQVLISKLMGFAAGIGGGIALLLMIMGAFQMMTSAGNPESIKKGRDQFIAAAIGLIFIIFSATLLRILGVDILNIPGFG